MSAFRELRDVSNIFEGELRKISADLFSARVGESFEDTLAKKLRDLMFFKSKLRLLQGKPVIGPPETVSLEKDMTMVVNDYSESVTWKIIEELAAKRVTQVHAVRTLLRTPNSTLDPESVEKKGKILEALQAYGCQDFELHKQEMLLRNVLDDHETVRTEWDQEMGKLRAMSAAASTLDAIDTSTASYSKLHTLVDKMQMIQWLIPKLVMVRNVRYDWLADPHNRLKALKLSRESITVEKFMEGR